MEINISPWRAYQDFKTVNPQIREFRAKERAWDKAGRPADAVPNAPTWAFEERCAASINFSIVSLVLAVIGGGVSLALQRYVDPKIFALITSGSVGLPLALSASFGLLALHDRDHAKEAHWEGRGNTDIEAPVDRLPGRALSCPREFDLDFGLYFPYPTSPQ